MCVQLHSVPLASTSRPCNALVCTPREAGRPSGSGVRCGPRLLHVLTFLTLPGHFRGPRRTIQFTILGRGDRLILRQVGATSLGIFDRAYDGGAWFSWRTQAATLRAALSGGPLGQS